MSRLRATSKLPQLMEQEAVVAPGVFDGMSAKLTEQAGFNAVYASGGAISRGSGYPDLGLLSYSEICDRLGQIVDVTDLPVIADADTGYGNALNVRRTVEELEMAGIAGMSIEDTDLPNPFGSGGKASLISVEEGVGKMKAAL